MDLASVVWKYGTYYKAGSMVDDRPSGLGYVYSLNRNLGMPSMFFFDCNPIGILHNTNLCPRSSNRTMYMDYSSHRSSNHVTSRIEVLVVLA